MAKLLTLLVLKLFFVQIHCIFGPTPVLQIPQGRLIGLVAIGGSQRKYLGIPYGTVEERFQEAGPPPGWKGVFNAIDSSIICPQSLLSLPTGVEDCLILNVYTPREMSNEQLYPVMVFIHGGAFQTGSSNYLNLYNPEFLVEKGVIVVTINYRLGSFGFLCLGINGAPGNIGLKDQVAALKWVQDNIKYFGGDPDSVTIFGESAGSASVAYLILSPAAKGLYKRAIMESGTALSPFAFSEDPIEKASMVAATMGYNTKNPYELLEIFKNATMNEIIIATESTVTDNIISNIIFRPCAENQGTKPFLTMSPQEMLNSGIYNKVPMIIGYNDKEGIFFANFNIQQYQILNKDFGRILPENLYFSNETDRKRIADKVKSFYFGNRTTVLLPKNEESTEGLIDLISDIEFHYPSVSTAEYFLKHNHMPIYNYYFKYDSYRNLAKLLWGMPGQKGAAHGDELFYLFQPIIISPLPIIGNDRIVIDRMTSMWTNFAKFGNPTAIKSAALNVDWAASNDTELRYLNIDKDLTMGPLPNPERIDFWKNIYESNAQV